MQQRPGRRAPEDLFPQDPDPLPIEPAIFALHRSRQGMSELRPGGIGPVQPRQHPDRGAPAGDGVGLGPMVRERIYFVGRQLPIHV